MTLLVLILSAKPRLPLTVWRKSDSAELDMFETHWNGMPADEIKRKRNHDTSQRLFPCSIHDDNQSNRDFKSRYAIPKINMLHNLSCCETRFRLPCRWYLLHSSLNLLFRQHKLHNIFIFGMAYWFDDEWKALLTRNSSIRNLYSTLYLITIEIQQANCFITLENKIKIKKLSVLRLNVNFLFKKCV